MIFPDEKELMGKSYECEEYCIEKERYEDYFWMYAENAPVSRLKYIFKERLYEDESHIRVLNFAIIQNNLDLVKLLLKHCANPNSFRSYKKSSKYNSCSTMVDAIMDAKCPKIVELLLGNGLDPNYSDAHRVEGWNWFPIFDAIEIRSIKIVQILLDHGAEPNSSKTIGYINGKSYGEPALSYAVRLKMFDMVDLLLKYSADATASRTFKNKYGTFKSSVLGDAIWQSQNPDMVKVLLENGANANHIETFVNEKGIPYKRSMLSYAISNAQNIEMVEDLLKHGVNPNKVVKIQKSEEITPLLIEAIQCKSVPIVKLLLEQNANVNACKT